MIEVEEIEQVSQVKNGLYESNFRRHRFFVISYGTFGIVIIVLGIVAIILTGAFPCLHTKCHFNATCTNKPFYAECECNPGFSGNGRDHCDECGVTYFDHNAHKHSEVSVPYSWPATGILEFIYTAFARIGFRNSLINEFDNCGLVLINRRTGLTAAHCIKKYTKFYSWFYAQEFLINVTFNNFHPNLESIYTAYFGTHHFVYFNVDLPHAQLGGIHEIHIHPDYDEKTYLNDIAVIKFSNDIELNRYIQVACLPQTLYTEESLLSKVYAYIAGFSSSGNDFTSWVEHNVKLNLYNSSMCKMVEPGREKNWDLQLCAGEYSVHGNTTGQCHGDYGSPLYVHETVGDKKKYVVRGILSYDVPCNVRHSPAVFTKIEAYLDWIKELSKY